MVVMVVMVLVVVTVVMVVSWVEGEEPDGPSRVWCLQGAVVCRVRCLQGGEPAGQKHGWAARPGRRHTGAVRACMGPTSTESSSWS